MRGGHGGAPRVGSQLEEIPMRFVTWKRASAALLSLSMLGLTQAAFAETVRFRASLDATAHPTAVDSNGDGEVAYFGIWEGRSNLGPVSQEGLAEFLPWDGATFCGPTNVEVAYRFAEYALRFKDGSRLFTTLSSGTFCINYATGTYDSTLEVKVIGGTGRFAGATGTLGLQVSSQAVFPDGLGVFTATYEGTINVR
jgi:hypothetical protein